MNYTYEDMAKMIDHSLLNPTLTVDDLERGIQLALEYDVASVCIMPYYLKRCAEALRGSRVNASTTIGFPHGGHTSAVKLAEARQALADGCQELDLVVNISKSAQRRLGLCAARTLAAVIEAAHEAGTEGQSHLRELLSERRAEDPALRNLRGAERGLGKDIHRLWHGRRHHGGSGADAAALAGLRASEGGRRRARPGRAAAGARAGRVARGGHAHGGDAGRMQAAADRFERGVSVLTRPLVRPLHASLFVMGL
jgi:hypothetical protein